MFYGPDDRPLTIQSADALKTPAWVMREGLASLNRTLGYHAEQRISQLRESVLGPETRVGVTVQVRLPERFKASI